MRAEGQVFGISSKSLRFSGGCGGEFEIGVEGAQFRISA